MIEFIQKLLFLWEKKMHLTRVRCEQDFILENFGDKIHQDLSGSRGRLAKLRMITNPQTETKQEIMILEQEINSTEQYKNILKRGELTETELKSLIKITKKNLWR